MRRPLGLLLGIPLLAACATGRAPLPDGASRAGAAQSPADDGWRVADPAAVGLDPARLEAMTAAIRAGKYPNVHAVLIEKDGRLAYEAYFTGTDQRWGTALGEVAFDRATKHDLRSVSKSVTSALLGIALAGDTAALARPIVEFFPEHADLATPERRAITLRHVLTMSTGQRWDEETPYTDPRNDEIGMTRSVSPVRYVLERAPEIAPGTRWNYNGGTTQLLAEVVQRRTGRPLRDYAREVLFQPLGITDWEWLGDLAGAPAAASGLRLRPRDLAKIGSLYLHDGRWNGRQVVPAGWVRESLRPRVVIDTVSGMGYGYQWWIQRLPWAGDTLEVPAAIGNGQQRIYLLRDRRMAVTILAGRYNDPTAGTLARSVLLEQVLPAVR